MNRPRSGGSPSSAPSARGASRRARPSRSASPRCKLLARAELVGDGAEGVPEYAPGAPVDGDALLVRRTEFILDGMGEALTKDIPGTSFRIVSLAEGADR